MEPLLTIPETAAILKQSPERTYEQAARGELPCIRLSPRRIRVPVDELQAWIAEKTVRVEPEEKTAA